ncbi:MAG: SGNH hydrolase domain-containing protein [Thiotrichales bacterium]
MFAETLLNVAKSNHYSLEIATRNGCPIALPDTFEDLSCESYVRSVLERIKKRTEPYDVVIVSNSGKYPLKFKQRYVPMAKNMNEGLLKKSINGYAYSVSRALNVINARSHTILVEPVPFSPNNIPACLIPSLVFDIAISCETISEDYVTTYRNKTVGEIRDLISSSIITYDPSKKLCHSDGSCSMFIGNKFVYRDNIHLSRDGALEYMADFEELLKKVVNQ